MGPRTLVRKAKALGITLLALTDHNCGRNTPAFEIIARKEGIFPLCGVEVTTSEEVHVLCFFKTAEKTMVFGKIIEDSLPKIPLNHEKMGDQLVVNEEEEILDEVDFYLGTASSLGIAEVQELCHRLGGIFIPAHIDRPSSSLLSQLGYLPDLPYDGFETHRTTGGLDTGKAKLVKGSDAHHPDMIGQRTCELDLPELSWEAIKEYFSR